MLVISNRNYSPDYSLNCTPLGPITIMYDILSFPYFTPVGDLQATDISNLLQVHINKSDI